MNKNYNEVIKLPKGYWFTRTGEASSHLQLLWTIFKSKYPNFLDRRQKVTSDMINSVMNEFKKFTRDERITFGKIQQQLKPSFDVYTDSEEVRNSGYYSKYDQAMLKWINSNLI